MSFLGMDSQFLPNRTLNEFTTNKSCVLEKTEILVDVKTGEKKIQFNNAQFNLTRNGNPIPCVRVCVFDKHITTKILNNENGRV